MRILRIYNNNVALAVNYSGTETVVVGRGLAFAKRKGDMVDPKLVEQTFVPESGTSQERLNWSLSEIPAEILSLAIELESEVKAAGGFTISHSFIIPLADHLNFAVLRAKEGDAVDYPLALEVTQLYPRELEFGQRARDLTNQRLGVTLPEQEAIPLALHLVNSQFATGDMNQTFRMTEIFSQIFELISTVYGQEVDQTSMSAARFISHLRYLFVRVEKKGSSFYQDETPAALLEAVQTSYPRAFACAQKLYLLLEMQTQQELTDGEITYLTLHVARLAKDLNLD
ncbi:MAG: PRD domain-containing protein [Rothia sp. (in: high G+C Gram-positive bacteria)]|nr:PRD domain-containing protein [Rothia sp. (in: high G+C Gram-positive bacteria)]